MVPITIRKIKKEDIPACTSILRSLPQWFGIEQAILNYEQSLTDLDGYVAEGGSAIVGFVGLKRCETCSIEINVIGVQPELRHSGIGRTLLEYVEANATTPSTRLLHTKTIAPSWGAGFSCRHISISQMAPNTIWLFRTGIDRLKSQPNVDNQSHSDPPSVGVE